MSGFLVNKSLLDPTVTQYSGGTASFTLPQSGSTNATEVYVGGVPQVAGVDFTVSGTTLTLTTSAPAGSNMVCARQYFADGITGTPASNSVATAAVQDNAINLAKMAGGTDGQIITYDASGDPVAVGPGTDGQVLTSTGAGSPPAFEDAASGAWAVRAAATFTATTSIEFTLNSAKYQRIYLLGVRCQTEGTANPNSTALGIQIDPDNAGYDTSGYQYGAHKVRSSGTHTASVTTGQTYILLTGGHNYAGGQTDNGEIRLDIPVPQPTTGDWQQPTIIAETNYFTGSNSELNLVVAQRASNVNIYKLKLYCLTASRTIHGKYVHMELN